MTRRTTFDQELFAHFVTFSCYRRRKLLDHDHPKRIVLGVLNGQLRKLRATCMGFVIMPDHVHAVVWFPETGQLSMFMQEWKRTSSRNIRAWYREHPAAYAFGQDVGEKFWQQRYYSFEIYSQEKLEEKIEYMLSTLFGLGLWSAPWTGSGVPHGTGTRGIPSAYLLAGSCERPLVSKADPAWGKLGHPAEFCQTLVPGLLRRRTPGLGLVSDLLSAKA